MVVIQGHPLTAIVRISTLNLEKAETSEQTMPAWPERYGGLPQGMLTAKGMDDRGEHPLEYRFIVALA
jgi:hypothetical protein